MSSTHQCSSSVQLSRIDYCTLRMTTAAGAFSQSLVVATSYSTLGVDGVCEALTQCECPVVVCNRNKVSSHTLRTLKKTKDFVP